METIEENNKINQPLISENTDEYIGAKVKIPHGDEVVEAPVWSCKKTSDGNNLVGVSDVNPIYDSRIYIIEFPDRSYEEYTTNSFAGAIFDYVDNKG